MRLIFAVVVVALTLQELTMAQNVIYTSGYSNKIDTFLLDLDNGSAEK